MHKNDEIRGARMTLEEANVASEPGSKRNATTVQEFVTRGGLSVSCEARFGPVRASSHAVIRAVEFEGLDSSAQPA